MGYKKVCINCRISFNQKENFDNTVEYSCTKCGTKMILLPHRFRPPKTNDIRKWNIINYLVNHGFLFQHIYKIENGILLNVYEDYPKTLEEAKEFVLLYKEQSLKNKLFKNIYNKNF